MFRAALLVVGAAELPRTTLLRRACPVTLLRDGPLMPPPTFATIYCVTSFCMTITHACGKEYVFARSGVTDSSAFDVELRGLGQHLSACK